MLAFAANSIMTRYLVANGLGSGFAVAIVRFVSGLAMLLALRVAIPGLFSSTRYSKLELPGAFFLGTYAFAISFGYLFISAAAGTLVFYALVVVTMSGHSYTIDRTRIRIRAVLGQLLALLGVVIITFGKIGDVTLPGVLLLSATGVSWGFYSVLGRRSPDANSYTFNTFLVLGLFMILSLPFAVVLAPGLLDLRLSANGVGLLLFMGAISTALSYVVWNQTTRRISGAQAGVVQLAVPVLTAGMAIGLLGESVTASLLIGGVAVLAGIYLNLER